MKTIPVSIWSATRLSPLRIGRDDGTTQAEGRVIRNGKCFCFVLNFKDHGDGGEKLLMEGRIARRDVAQQGRCKEVTGAIKTFASHQHLGTGGHGLLNLLQCPVEC